MQNMAFSCLSTFTVFWLTLYLIKCSARYYYGNDINNGGVYFYQKKLVFLGCEFTCFNGKIAKWSHFLPELMHQGYFLSIFVTGFTMVFGVLFLFYNLTQQLITFFSNSSSLTPNSQDSSSSSSSSMEMMIPGVNMPVQSIGYIWLAILLSLIFHELGHGLVACKKGLKISSVGVFLAGIFPGAFVRIDYGYISLSLIDKLQILSAGVWHNFVLSFAFYLLITVQPIFLGVVYNLNSGAVISNVPSNSVFNGILYPGDVIQSIDHAHIHNVLDWNNEISNKKLSLTEIGYCAPSSFLQYSRGTHCCDKKQYEGIDHCFSIESVQHKTSQGCFIAKDIGKISSESCTSSSDCYLGKEREEKCFKPVLTRYNMVITRLKLSNDSIIMYEGDLDNLSLQFVLTDYAIPHILSKNLPLSIVEIMLYLPVVFKRFCNFVINISTTIGLLNSLPVHFFDGCHLLEGFLLLFLGKKPTNSIVQLVLYTVDVLLAVNLILIIVSSFY